MIHIIESVSHNLEHNTFKKCIVVGEWNARFRSLGVAKSSKDPVEDSEGADFLALIDAEGDWLGEFTHTDYTTLQRNMHFSLDNGSLLNRER